MPVQTGMQQCRYRTLALLVQSGNAESSFHAVPVFQGFGLSGFTGKALRRSRMLQRLEEGRPGQRETGETGSQPRFSGRLRRLLRGLQDNGVAELMSGERQGRRPGSARSREKRSEAPEGGAAPLPGLWPNKQARGEVQGAVWPSSRETRGHWMSVPGSGISGVRAAGKCIRRNRKTASSLALIARDTGSLDGGPGLWNPRSPRCRQVHPAKQKDSARYGPYHERHGVTGWRSRALESPESVLQASSSGETEGQRAVWPSSRETRGHWMSVPGSGIPGVRAAGKYIRRNRRTARAMALITRDTGSLDVGPGLWNPRSPRCRQVHPAKQKDSEQSGPHRERHGATGWRSWALESPESALQASASGETDTSTSAKWRRWLPTGFRTLGSDVHCGCAQARGARTRVRKALRRRAASPAMEQQFSCSLAASPCEHVKWQRARLGFLHSGPAAIRPRSPCPPPVAFAGHCDTRCGALHRVAQGHAGSACCGFVPWHIPREGRAPPPPSREGSSG